MQRRSIPWWNEPGRTAESIVRLDSRCLGLRVRLETGERVTMPLHPMSLMIDGDAPPRFADPA